MYQDSNDYLWVGTANGLNRFDGKRFVNYGSKNGLPSLFIDKVYEDRHHRLWIGTRRGMAELKGDTCFTYPVSDKKEISFVNGFMETDNGRLWAATNNGIYELSKNIWEKISLIPGMDNESISIFNSKNGLYITYNNNTIIHRLKDGSYKTLLAINTKRPYFSSFFERNDTVFISTYTGLQYWNGTNWIKLFNDTLSKKYIYTAFRDNSNRFWLGTKEDGLLGILPSGNNVTYQHIPLSFNLVSNFFEDRNQNIWVAGFQGLLKISSSLYETVVIPSIEKIFTIRNFIIMPNGNFLVSAEDGKLLLIKPSLSTNNKAEVISTFRLKKQNDFIDFHTFDNNHNLWFTTRENSLYLVKGNALIEKTSIIHFKNERIRDIAYNQKLNKIFVCADSVLLWGDENRLDTFFSPGKKQFVPLPNTIHINEEDGSLLVQSLGEGVFLIKSTGEIKSLGKGSNFSKSFKSVSKSTTETDIWAAQSGKDITRYSWKGSEVPEPAESITGKDGFGDYYIFDIAYDKNENLWIASAKGITIIKKVHPHKWIHRDIEINESGKVSPFSFSVLREDIDGNMWMNQQNKLIVFKKNKIQITTPHTKTVIEKVQLFDRPTNWSFFSDTLANYMKIPISPVLNHDQNTLSIIFNAVFLDNSSSPEYSYRLFPSDTIWSNSTASNIVTLYQLKPGNYQFQVRSHIKGFDWSEPAVFSFIIKKPFWETWWFRSFIILLGSAIILIIFRYRLNQLKVKSEMQNQVREMEMKALKAQMSPHFIHNALNSIQSLIINNRSNEASYYISKFAKLLRQVLENSDKNLISLDKELYSLHLYMELEKLRMNMDFEYLENIDETIITTQLKIPPLLLQPFVENALWHGLSNKEGDKKLNLSITEKEGWIIFKIQDNGIGRIKAGASASTFPEGSLSKAVNITTQRLADFNQAPGTEPVSFVDHEEKGQASGTTVIIRINTRHEA